MDYIKHIRRFFRNKLHIFFYHLCESVGSIKIDVERSIDISRNSHELLEGFTVLLSSTSNYYIPSRKVEKYSNFLGIRLSRRFFITSNTISNSGNFHVVRDRIFNALSNKFNGNTDILALLEYIYVIGKEKSYFSGNLVHEDYTVVSMDNLAKRKDKVLYTFAQTGCIVIVIHVNNKFVIMGHYNSKKVGDFFDKISEILSRSDCSNIECYIISYEPIKHCMFLLRRLSVFTQKIKIHYYEKLQNIEDKITCNFKLKIFENNLEILYSYVLTQKHISRKFRDLHFLDSRALIIKSDYQEMTFTEFNLDSPPLLK